MNISSLISIIRLMNDFYFGNQFIGAAYAPTGRAACKACKQKIEAQSIRLSYNVDTGNFTSTYWYHLNCFELKPKFADIDPEQKIYNLDQIDDNPTGYDLVVNYINAEKERLKKGEKRSKPVVAKKQDNGQVKQQKLSQNLKDSEDQVSDSKGGQKKKQKKIKQKQKESQQYATHFQVYTAEQQKEYEELIQKYNSVTAQALKQILARNHQSRTGNKAQLAEKCADGNILGQIPHCPKCGGGRPKFNKETGTYKCPGYMDDDKYRHCHKTFRFNEIQREKWID